MGLAIISPGRDPEAWIENIKELDAEIDIQVYPNIVRKEDVEAVMLWNHPKGLLSEFPNLKLICSMGAGVDHILSDDSIPAHLPITRIIDERLTISMTNYVVMGVLNYHRQYLRYQEQQAKKVWDMSSPEIEINVGVLGVGELGGDVIEKLRLMKFNVAGYGNSPKKDLQYPYYYGEQLDEFLSQVNMIICLLPLTPQTENFLDKDFFNRCKPGSYIINVARGKHLVEEDLLEAIEEDQISGAMLDVFLNEPLPEEHPFWINDRIMVTPHIASVTNPSAAAPQILSNYYRLLNQKPLVNVIDRNRGY